MGTYIDEAFCRKLRTALNSAIERVAMENEEFDGVDFRLGNIRYEPTQCKVTLTVQVDGSAEGDKSHEQIEYEKAAIIYSLPEYGSEVRLGGYTYRIVGYKKRNRKYPVIAERLNDGIRYKLPRTAIGGW